MSSKSTRGRDPARTAQSDGTSEPARGLIPSGRPLRSGATPQGGGGGRLRRFLYSLAVMVAILGLLEGGLRLIVPRLLKGKSVRVSRAAPRREPNSTMPAFRWGANKTISADANGFRTVRSRPPPSQDNKVILAYGDSNTFGWGLDDHETWPARLDRLLAPSGYRVINGGLPGATVVTTLQNS